MDKLHAFYISKAWRDLSLLLKVQAGGRCSDCGKVYEDYSLLIGHHMPIELTEDNVDDALVSLNPSNIKIICQRCHNIQHHRDYGHTKQVYLIYGAPLAGKAEYVSQAHRQGDIVLNIEALWQAIAMGNSNRCKYNVFAIRDLLYDQIRTRYGQWYDAYVIGTYADRYDRERTAKELNAELIFINKTKEECYARAKDKPPEYIGYIDKWFDTYDRTRG